MSTQEDRETDSSRIIFYCLIGLIGMGIIAALVQIFK